MSEFRGGEGELILKEISLCLRLKRRKMLVHCHKRHENYINSILENSIFNNLHFFLFSVYLSVCLSVLIIFFLSQSMVVSQPVTLSVTHQPCPAVKLPTLSLATYSFLSQSLKHENCLRKNI